MRIAIISDIHGNAIALDAVLADIERASVERIVCLGDVAGTGPDPVGTLERVRRLDCPVVMGNVDGTMLDQPSDDSLDDLTESDRMIAEIDAWCADQLSASHTTFIRSFDSTLELERPNGIRLFCYHGSPRSSSEGVYATTPEERLDDMFDGIDANLFAGGHTHFPFTRRSKGVTLLNPGSVGLPYIWDRGRERYRCPPWAEYALVLGSRDTLRVELRRCPLDVASVVEAARESDMPYVEWWTGQWQRKQ